MTKKLDKGKGRLLSLDVMRGITIAGMIVVNNAGGPDSYTSLQHSYWNGLTPCDLVFPFFLFIMGVTTWLSLSRHIGKATTGVIAKILRRTVTILLIGWGLHWLENVAGGKGWLDFGHLRLTGVLTRIALCYLIVSLLLVYTGLRATLWTGGVLLAAYAVMLLYGSGYDYEPWNINAVIDRAILGTDHLYTKKPVDPEGLASTLSAITHTIIGVWCGKMIKDQKDIQTALIHLFTAGFLMLCAGFIGSEWFAVNKRIWSPTFVLVTCGVAASLLATLIWTVDVKGHSRWCPFFEVFGVNPLFLYVLSEVAAVFIKKAGIDEGVYDALLSVIPDPLLASAAYSVALMIVMWGIGYPLYRRRIFIKI